VQQVASRLAQVDARLRYVRQPVNLGHAANYQWVLDAARGTYFMWLADDDWLDPSYVSACLAALRSDPALRLVCGQGSYYRGDAHVIDERPITLESPRPGFRVLRYLSRVSVNGPLFGVAQRADFLDLGFPQEVGGDWLLVAQFAARGRIRTLSDVRIHRSISGLGSDASGLAASFGMRGVAARYPHLVLAARFRRQIAAGHGAFHEIDAGQRRAVGTLAAGLIVCRFVVVSLIAQLLGRRLADQVEGAIARRLRTGCL